MDKMKYEKGLISYTTERNVTSDKKTHALRPKIIGYMVVMLIIVGIFVADVVTRIPMDLDIIRDRNQLYRINTEGLVENTFTLKILNKSQKDHRYEISIDGLNNYSIIGKTSVTIRTGESYSLPLSIAIDPYDLSSPITEFDFVLNRADDPDVKIEHSSKYFKGR
jgi:polyferredoxin